MELTKPFQGRLCVRRLGCAMINVCIKFEVVCLYRFRRQEIDAKFKK